MAIAAATPHDVADESALVLLEEFGHADHEAVATVQAFTADDVVHVSVNTLAVGNKVCWASLFGATCREQKPPSTATQRWSLGVEVRDRSPRVLLS